MILDSVRLILDFIFLKQRKKKNEMSVQICQSKPNAHRTKSKQFLSEYSKKRNRRMHHAYSDSGKMIR